MVRKKVGGCKKKHSTPFVCWIFKY